MKMKAKSAQDDDLALREGPRLTFIRHQPGVRLADLLGESRQLLNTSCFSTPALPTSNQHSSHPPPSLQLPLTFLFVVAFWFRERWTCWRKILGACSTPESSRVWAREERAIQLPARTHDPFYSRAFSSSSHCLSSRSPSGLICYTLTPPPASIIPVINFRHGLSNRRVT